MADKLFPLICGVRTWNDSDADLCTRLEAHLLRRRKVRMVEEPGEFGPPQEEQLLLPLMDRKFDFDPEPQPAEIVVELRWQEQRRIAGRVRKLLAARAAASGLSHLRDADRKQLEARLPGVRLAGPRTEHEADEMAASLLDELPWMRELIEHVWRGARRSARDGALAPGQGGGRHEPPDRSQRSCQAYRTVADPGPHQAPAQAVLQQRPVTRSYAVP